MAIYHVPAAGSPFRLKISKVSSGLKHFSTFRTLRKKIYAEYIRSRICSHISIEISSVELGLRVQYKLIH